MAGWLVIVRSFSFTLGVCRLPTKSDSYSCANVGKAYHCELRISTTCVMNNFANAVFQGLDSLQSFMLLWNSGFHAVVLSHILVDYNLYLLALLPFKLPTIGFDN